MKKSPRTDATFNRVWLFKNEEEADDALGAMRDLSAELEDSNDLLRGAALKFAAIAVSMLNTHALLLPTEQQAFEEACAELTKVILQTEHNNDTISKV